MGPIVSTPANVRVVPETLPMVVFMRTFRRALLMVVAGIDEYLKAYCEV